MPTLPDGTFFSAMSPLPEYEKKLKQMEDECEVAGYVTLIRGMLETHWYKSPPTEIPVSKPMYDAIMEKAKAAPAPGIGWSLHAESDKVMLTRIPVVVRPE